MAVALGKKRNAADGRFGRALRGLQGFPISALASLDGQPARLRKAALISESPEGQRRFWINRGALKQHLSPSPVYGIIALLFWGSSPIHVMTHSR